MANSYNITSVSSVGDVLTVIGTVTLSGTTIPIPVTVTVWVSAAGNTLASAISFQNYIQPLMLLQAVPSTPTLYPSLNISFSK